MPRSTMAHLLFRVAALTLTSLVLLGCGTTFRPGAPTRVDVVDAHIDVVEARVTDAGAFSSAFAAEVVLRTRMPVGTRLRQLMFVNARLGVCSGGGIAATAIRLDDASIDAGISIDVAGEHRIVATFANAGSDMLAGPVAIDWYDDVDGERRCGRIALVDSEPGHAWTNESRWSFGLGGRLVVPFAPIGYVAGIFDFPAFVRYRLSDGGAFVGSPGCGRDVDMPLERVLEGVERRRQGRPLDPRRGRVRSHVLPFGRVRPRAGGAVRVASDVGGLADGHRRDLDPRAYRRPSLRARRSSSLALRAARNLARLEPRPRDPRRPLGRRSNARHLVRARREPLAQLWVLIRRRRGAPRRQGPVESIPKSSPAPSRTSRSRGRRTRRRGTIAT